MRVQLTKLAHARSGDKGDTANVGLIALRDDAYPILVREVTAVSPIPVAVGFGVSTPAHVRAIARAGAAGVIVASALVDALGDDGTNVPRMEQLVRTLAAATRIG